MLHQNFDHKQHVPWFDFVRTCFTFVHSWFVDRTKSKGFFLCLQVGIIALNVIGDDISGQEDMVSSCLKALGPNLLGLSALTAITLRQIVRLCKCYSVRGE